MKNATITVNAGSPHPLGATVMDGGVNFSLFSKNAMTVLLLLFDNIEDSQPSRIFVLDPRKNRTFYYWHIFIGGIGVGQIYAYRVDGPYAPREGNRFNVRKVLIDPYARSIVNIANWSRKQACLPKDNVSTAMKCAVVDDEAYDWEGDKPLGRPLGETVTYEMHVAGFTKHSSSGVKNPGTYRGVIEKIPYLQELGITAVELLPIYQFDPQDVTGVNPVTGEPLSNFWGYTPIGFFAPHQGYATQAGTQVNEFRDMVKALHRAGIEVILDVVFNHTAEGKEDGPTICYRGLENRAYYLLKDDKRKYQDYTGCGNTLNCNHSIVRRLIMNSLHYWVEKMHVDGFRFDLASVLSRDEDGNPMENPPVLWEIESDPVLAKTKIIAEAWDAAGLYQVGSFIGDRWAELNGRFRDDVRRFVKGDDGMTQAFATRIMGSTNGHEAPTYQPHRTVNYITCHDGFTLNDLVSYNEKHNLENGEQNRDGVDHNYSWNCGVEGVTDDAKIERVRKQQIKNFLTILMVSQGTPMLLAGDEIRRTQRGNNNAYCQDNEISWIDWRNREKHADIFRFCKHMIHFRCSHPTLHSREYIPGQPENEQLQITWHGVKPNESDWGHYSHSIAFMLDGYQGDSDIYVAINAYWQSLIFELPSLAANKRWFRVVDTSKDTPNDILEEGKEDLIVASRYRVASRAVVVLISKILATTQAGGA